MLSLFHHVLWYLRTLYIVWTVTRRLTRLQTMCNVIKYRNILYNVALWLRCGCGFFSSIYLKPCSTVHSIRRNWSTLMSELYGMRNFHLLALYTIDISNVSRVTEIVKPVLQTLPVYLSTKYIKESFHRCRRNFACGIPVCFKYQLVCNCFHRVAILVWTFD